MTSRHSKMLGSALLAALVLIAVIALLGRPRESTPPQMESRATEPTAPVAPAPVASPPASRSKGLRDWAFFFRAGDTLSRMADGTTLGVVVRLERAHSFPDGSSGPAYVVRSAGQGEQVFDADELERSARVESVRDVLVPPARPDTGTARR